VLCYIDEFQDYLHLPTDLADVLAQARGLGLGLVLVKALAGAQRATVTYADAEGGGAQFTLRFPA